MKIALALIVKGSDDEAKLLRRCLGCIARYFDGIFITVTQPNEAVEEVCKRHNAVVSHFEWVNDFSAARNFNFSQVPAEYDYIMWVDSDDLVRGLETLRETIEKHPADAYSMYYMYSFDENLNPTVVHQKTQIVKNDGCVTWKGALHEDLAENRGLTAYFIKGIERIHTSNHERFEAAKLRNLEVAKGQLEKQPTDPRSFWNVGQSHSALGNYDEAIKTFDSFLEMSQSDDEKYIVRLRRAECYYFKGDLPRAIDEARYAIGTRPDYPDAYHALGRLYANARRYQEAVQAIMAGLVKKPPYFSIIVFNPRDYDFNPMILLAEIMIKLERPDQALPLLEACNKISPSANLEKSIFEIKEKIKVFEKVIKTVKKLENVADKAKVEKALAKLPTEVQSHPSICLLRNKLFVKETSSGRDLVYYCGYTARQWTPEIAAKEGIGGSEEAVIHLSRLFAQAGWNVTVYNNCGHEAKVFEGVTYKPFWTYNYRDKQDVTIIWRTPAILDYAINSDRIYVDLHDVIPPGEFTERRQAKITKVFVKSEFHKTLFPNILPALFVINPNGIVPDVFMADLPRNPKLIVNTSSPDRSLSALIGCFKEVKKQVPDAQCKWAYGWGVFDTTYASNSQRMAWKAKLEKEADEAGIEMLGMISHKEVARLYLTANVFGYPSEFAEIDCISLTKAMASGAIPVTTDFSAMGEKVRPEGVFIHSQKTKDNWAGHYQYDFSITDEAQKKQWVDSVVRILKNPPTENERKDMRQWAMLTYDWQRIAEVWLGEFSTPLPSPTPELSQKAQ